LGRRLLFQQEKHPANGTLYTLLDIHYGCHYSSFGRLSKADKIDHEVRSTGLRQYYHTDREFSTDSVHGRPSDEQKYLPKGCLGDERHMAVYAINYNSSTRGSVKKDFRRHFSCKIELHMILRI